MKTIFLSKNALPRGSGQFLKSIVTLIVLCTQLGVYAQPTLITPADGSNNVTLPVTLEWNDNAPLGVSKIEISECGPGTVANNIDLDGYVQVPQSPITVDALEVSGVTYNLSTNQLVMVADTRRVYITDLSGNILRTIVLSGFQDTEGIVHIGGTRYAVTEERKGEVVFFNIYSNTTTVYYANCDIVEMPILGGGWGANDGLEGVSYNPVEDKIHTVKEKDDKGYYTFPVPGNFPATAQANVNCDIDADPFSLIDVAGIHHLGLNDLSAANLSPDVSNHVLLLSQESHAIVETDGSCTEYGRLCLPPDSNLQLEGVTMDNNGNIYVVSEVNDANDNSLKSRLYIYTNPNFNSGNSKKIVHTNILGANEYEVPQGILQQGVEYCWRTSTLFYTLCNWSDTWSFTVDDGTSGNCPADLIITNADVAGQFYEVSNTIETDPTGAGVLVVPGDDLTLQAGYSVRLNFGFEAQEGSLFHAYIEDCASGFSEEEEEKEQRKEEQPSTFASVKHYPNPFRDEITLEFELEADSDIQIIVSDVSGRKIAQTLVENQHHGVQTINLPTKDWMPGMYFYQVQINERETANLKYANGTLVKM